MFFLVVVTVKLAIDPHLPDAISFAHLNTTSLRWPPHVSPLFAANILQHGLLVGHVWLLCLACAHVSKEHHGADEFFGVVVGFAVVVFMLDYAHRFYKPLSKVVDEPRLRAGHVGDQGLQDSFMSQHPPLEIGRLSFCLLIISD